MDRIDELEIEIVKLQGFTKGLAESLRDTVEELERIDDLEIEIAKLSLRNDD